MNLSAIDSGRIESMLSKLKATAQKPEISKDFDLEALTGVKLPVGNKVGVDNRVDFANVLKSSLNQVNDYQSKAEILGRNFALGDDSVSLSDVMIAGQKANISFQAAIQVRNKVVSAYQEVMGMQI